MTGKTHLLAGANAAGWALLATSPATWQPWWIAVGALGGLLPDLDASESELQNVGVRLWRRGPRLKLFKLPALIAHALFGHRGFLHSLLALAIILGALALFRLPLELAVSLGLGYGSHLLLDGLTRSGLPLFYPSRRRVRLVPAGLRTGGIVDHLLFLTGALALIGLIATMAPTLGIGLPK